MPLAIFSMEMEQEESSQQTMCYLCKQPGQLPEKGQPFICYTCCGWKDSEKITNAYTIMHFMLTYRERSTRVKYLKPMINSCPNINDYLEEEERSRIYTVLGLLLKFIDPTYKTHVKLVELTLQKGASLKEPAIRSESYKWKPYLSTAISRTAKKTSNLDIVKLLIKYGADVNFKLDGNSPLHQAINSFTNIDWFYNILADLLEAGADPNARNSKEITPLAMFAKHYDPSSNEIILRPGIGEKIIEKFLDYGALLTLQQHWHVMCAIYQGDRISQNSGKRGPYYTFEPRYMGLKSNYELLKPIIPSLDEIIKKNMRLKIHN